MSELPEGWAEAELGSLGRWASGATPSKSNAQYWTGTIPWVSPKDLKSDFIADAIDHVSRAGIEAANLKVLPPGTLLFVVRGLILARAFPVAITQVPVAINQDLRALTPHSGIDARYLFRALQHLSSDILHAVKEATHGTLRLDAEDLQKWPIRIPPFDEQRRIAEKVEALLARVGVACARMENVHQAISRLRDSALSMLSAPRRVGSKCALGEITSDIRYGTALKCDYEIDGVPVLRIPNLQHGRIDHFDLKFGRLQPREHEKLALRVGDLLMIRSNGSVSLVGRSAVATAREHGFAFAGYLIRVRPRLDLVDPRFIRAVLETPESRAIIEATARSTSGVHNINSEEIKALPLVLPPLHEQRIIADRFEALDRTLAAVRTRVNGGANLSKQLAQSILAKAFAGELVPTDAELARRDGRSYEPAAVLLERVRGDSGRSAGHPHPGPEANAFVHHAHRQRRPTRG